MSVATFRVMNRLKLDAVVGKKLVLFSVLDTVFQELFPTNETFVNTSRKHLGTTDVSRNLCLLRKGSEAAKLSSDNVFFLFDSGKLLILKLV